MIVDPATPRVEGVPPSLIEKTYDSYYVDARIAHRGRNRAATIEEAKEKGLPIAKELAKEGETAIQLPPEDRRIYIIAKDTLAPFKIAVDTGARRLADMLKQLGNDSFQTVHDTFKASSRTLKLGVKTPEIFDLYMFDQEVVRGNGAYHLRDVKRHVGKFVEGHPGEILTITTEQIDSWLQEFNGKAKTKNNLRDKVIAFFNFAQQKNYLPKNIDHAALSTTSAKDPRKVITTEEEALEAIERIEFFLPDELRRMLKVAPQNILPSIELKAFSGIRTEEVFRFWWVFVKELDKMIDVPKEIAKLKFRNLPILPNLQERLKAYAPEVKRGKVCKEWGSANSVYHVWVRVCKEAGVIYKKNAFRDSYITYRVALTNDPKLVARESGNSEEMIKEHYLHLATKEQAQEWFSL